MKKCEVLARIGLTVEKGSIVILNDRQYELVRKYVKPVEEKPATKRRTVKES